MKTNLYIFRHGQTVWNAEGRPQGQYPAPIPLTATGREQCSLLAEKLKDKNIKHIISSDLLRAEQSANIIAEIIGANVEFDPNLREINYGVLNGAYTIEREEIFPDYKKCYKDISIPFPEGESFAEVIERLNTGFKAAAKKYSGENIGISSHGRAVVSFLNKTFGLKLFRIENCDYIHLTYDDEKDEFEAIVLPH